MHGDLSFPLRATFLALPLDGAAKERFRSLQDSLRAFDRELRFQHPDSPHLTLMYWASVMEIEYHRIIRQAEKIAASHAPFTLHTTDIGTFGDRGDVHNLFLEVAFSPELATLKKSCPWPNAKPFHPHITLARVRHAGRFAVHRKEIMKRLSDVEFSIPVDRLRLYAEVEREKQTPLEDFPLFIHPPLSSPASVVPPRTSSHGAYRVRRSSEGCSP